MSTQNEAQSDLKYGPKKYKLYSSTPTSDTAEPGAHRNHSNLETLNAQAAAPADPAGSAIAPVATEQSMKVENSDSSGIAVAPTSEEKPLTTTNATGDVEMRDVTKANADDKSVEGTDIVIPIATPAGDDKDIRKARKRKLEVAALEHDNEALKFTSPESRQKGKYGLRQNRQPADHFQIEPPSSNSKTPSKTQKEEPETTTPPTRRSSRHDRDEKNKAKEGEKEKEREKEKATEEPVAYGDIVWATLPSHRVWFPALYVSHLHCGQKPPRARHAWVYWFGDHMVSEISKAKIKPFFVNFEAFSKGTSSVDGIRMKETLQALAFRAGLKIPTTDYADGDDEDPLKKWALEGFKLPDDKDKSKNIASDHVNPIPPNVACHLPVDAMQQEALKTDDRLQQLVFYDVQNEDMKDEEEAVVIPEFKQSQITRIKNGEITINDICIACCCDHNAAADTINGEKIPHPLFDGLLCKQCKETIKTTMYAPGEDNKNSFCAICGQVGKLAVCETSSCHKVFCFVCLNLYVGPEAEAEFNAAEHWYCFICNDKTLPTGCLLKPRADWRDLARTLFDPLRCYGIATNSLAIQKPLRVLSLYDGICSNYAALKKLNLTISDYYAVESDKDAVSVIKHNFKDSVHLIENIDSLSPSKLASITPIDLVIGGPPCVEVSSSSYNKKGVFDLKSGGSHFLHFHQILSLIRLFNKGHHVFFLFDSNTSMSTSNRDIISNLLMCKPVTLNAKGMCSPSRSRYLWSNIPGTNKPLSEEDIEKYTKLSNLITIANLKKANANGKEVEIGDDDPAELERLLGLEENCTDTGSLTKAKRVALLSKSWSADITAHVLWALVDFSQTHPKPESEQKSSSGTDSTSTVDATAAAVPASAPAAKSESNASSSHESIGAPVATATTDAPAVATS